MAISKVTGGGILDNSVTDADINSSKLNGVASSANNYTHPNHSGDVVSSADGATVIQTDAVDIAMLSATGSPGSTTFLRGDNSWAAAGSTSASDLTSGTIPAARIGDDVITADKLANSINSAIAANTSKTGITSSQANAITANTAKTGITSSQATAITAALPKAGGTLTGDISMGANEINTNNNINFADNGKARFGTGNDLQIYHDATRSYITNSTDSIRINSAGLEVNSADGSESLASFYGNGAVNLRHNNVVKVATTTGGVQFSGGVLFGSDTATANTLDDYEEGTFTMAIQDWSNATFSMGTIHVAKYTKVGNKVTIWFKGQVVSDSATPGGGDLKFSGFPYPTEGGKSIFVNPIFDHTTTNQTNAWLHFYGNGAYLYNLNSAGNPVDMTASLGGTTNMGLSFTYMTA